MIKVTKRTLYPHPEPPKAICCGRNVRVGQHVAVHGQAPTNRVFLHVACMRPIVAATPEDDADPTTFTERFERERRDLLALAGT